MIIGITKEAWIESLSLKEQDQYLKMVDNLIIVTEGESYQEPPYYFIKGDYDAIKELLLNLACCKAYPQRTWFSVNYSVVEITEGMTPTILRRRWIYELQRRNLV